MPDFSPEQDKALVAVSRWLAEKPGAGGAPQVFRLFGFAGTGKTMLAKHIAEGIDGTVKFAAFTGKAALVMRNRGCDGAQTIHSLIYRARDTDTETPQFQLWDNAPVSNASLIIVDECSMVDAELGNDLLSFGVPLLVLGDPAQLPPVSGGGFFTEAEPDVMLTEVHRQARDNPIIHLSMAVRAGEALLPGSYGETEVVPRNEFDGDRVLAADQVLVGRNATRRAYNARYRERLDIGEILAVADDRLVCLRNNRRIGLFNGSLWKVDQVVSKRAGQMKLRLIPEDDFAARPVTVSVRQECFMGGLEDLDWTQRKGFEEFDFGYVLTVHKAQGSQWDDVVLFDESRAFREHRQRWLYTGITRASERLCVVV
ncbi:MAG: AAA family ATPase [Rhodobiaceae bacterium]|nr:AAA family ATPase [Rhodobiaceae bacterium]